jgi:16S rRNA (guanine527-N7)-methyltransferase
MFAVSAPARLEPSPGAWASPPADAAQTQAALGADARQMADLESFRDLLAEWNQTMNLVGPSALAEFWSRHVYDSAQLLPLAPAALTWADLGAGAGFPGVVLAILLKDTAGARVHLVDSMGKRCRFLQAVVDALALPAQVHHARAETLKLKVDVVTARACAPLVRLLDYAQPYLVRGAEGIFLKGQDIVSELTEAAKYWQFEAHLTTSLSHPDGRILQVKGLERVRKI